MSVFSILLGGDIVVTERLCAQVAKSRIIAADGGIRHAKALHVMPELWLGDFDSTSTDDYEQFKTCPRQTFPREKDATDGELSVREAIKRGATSLILCGAFGGARPDHEFYHFVFATALYEKGIPVLLTSGNKEGYPLIAGQQQFDFLEKTLFSILGFSGLTQLSVHGAKWPLENANVPFGSSLTLSNEVSGKLDISLGCGRGILIAYPEPKMNNALSAH